MVIYKGQWIDDETGNVFYPHTSTDVVVNSAGKNVDTLLNEKAPSIHTHDDRYYTETEIDTKLNAKLSTTGNASNVTNTFTQATARTNLTTGEKLSASLGKIMKWFSDLKAVAFSGSYNDLTNKPTSLKNPTAMKVQLNGGTAEGTNQYTYDGSAAKNINITPSSIGAAASSHTHTPSQAGLSNVTNDAQVKRSEMGKASGVATLGTDSKVPTSQLPSSALLALGETSSTAYAGNKGKTTTDNVDAILAGTKAVPKAKDTEMFDGHTSQYYGKQTDVTAIKSQLNRNLISLTNSSYYPNANLYRSGQVCYLRCAGYLIKDVPAGTELTIGTASMMPDEYRPGTDLYFYPTIINNGTIIEVRIYSDGRVTFISPQKLIANTAINLHLSYQTGKSNF